MVTCSNQVVAFETSLMLLQFVLCLLLQNSNKIYQSLPPPEIPTNSPLLPVYSLIIIIYFFLNEAMAVFGLLDYFYSQTKMKQYREVSVISSYPNHLADGDTFVSLSSSNQVTVLSYQQIYFSSFRDNTQIEVENLKNGGARVFIAILEPIEFTSIYSTALELGIVGEHYVWVCYDSCANSFSLSSPSIGSNISQITSQMIGLFGVSYPSIVNPSSSIML